MSHDVQQDSRFYAFLTEIDRQVAERVREQGCPCGGPLHWGNFERKPRGPAALAADDAWRERFSLCCGMDGCRKRATPPSVRFAGRRVYAAVVVVLACAGIGKRASSKHLAAWRKATGVSARTVGRWLTWWRRIFVRTPLWVDGRAAFVPLVDETLLPGSLLERFDAESQLVALLRFVSPLSTGSVHAM